MIYPIRVYGDPILRQKARPVSDFSTIPKLAADMLETMHEARGVGLAAPQVGKSIAMFVWAEYADEEEEGEESSSKLLAEHVVINPRLESLDKSTVLGTEGCLSIPQIYEDDVPRAKALRLHYQNEHGEQKVLELEDYNARIVQHEFDHLIGRLYLDLLPKAVLHKHRAELTQMQKDAKAFLRDLTGNK
ncbi:MAG: peptide deformylase [Deinococcales bacterium]